MGKITVKVSYEEVHRFGEGIGFLVNQPAWLGKQGLDWQKPIYITPDKHNLYYYIDGWELEDAKKEKED